MKNIYTFGNKVAEGSACDYKILGGKGANLAEMTSLGIPVPPGFTISTEVCNYYMKNNKFPNELSNELKKSLSLIEKIMEKKFGCKQNPLLVSVRSGGRQSMPGMMETVLNIGLTVETIPGLIEQTQNENFVFDAYRRLITMYADVVMEKSANLNKEIGIRKILDQKLELLKKEEGVEADSKISIHGLKNICKEYKATIKSILGHEFPDDPKIQLWNSIEAVFNSWNGKRAINYRKIEKIPNNWGTAVNIQSMVFGNMGKDSATGVAFTRNPATGKNIFYGEWLPCAQGEDVVAGLRTPNPLNELSRVKNNKLPSLENEMPFIYKKLNKIRLKLENHYKDMQDIEFTIENGKLWMLQTRTGKRNGMAAIRIAIDLLNKKIINEKTALKRVSAEQLNETMHPMLNIEIEKNTKILTKGLPAGPGAAYGQIVFSSEDAEQWKKDGKKIILVRDETSPEDIHGMYASEAILTSRGGMTSHAALVARGWGKCCIVGCSEIDVDTRNKKLIINNKELSEGDWITMNGSSGNVYLGTIPLEDVNLKSNKYFQNLMVIADKYRKLKIRTNADTPDDAKIAKSFGAEGIGLCRTEHMFFEPNRIISIREMIVAKSKKERKFAIMKLLLHQQNDFYNLFKTMSPYPVTIRLLDPPLHEFIPKKDDQIKELAKKLNISLKTLINRINTLHELNPMLGHRGCRLGISYPEITEMQSTAIFKATAKLLKEGIKTIPEIMIPLVGSESELNHQKQIVNNVAKDIQKKKNQKLDYFVGTMIELPRACTIADKIAQNADFFSFGTNDLTQTTYGFSRDDISSFLPNYFENNILDKDPFQSIDIEGVGSLVKMGVKKGRSINKKLKIGICGEHGGDPESILFFNEIGLDYVSCSPYRVPIARLVTAQAQIC